jgi:hypothetical protein
MEPTAPPMPMTAAAPSYVNRFEGYLDRFLPAQDQKCDLFKCVPGWIWLVGAGLSIVASANLGLSALLKTIVWEAIVGWGVAWLCRGCHTRWLWFFLLIGTVLPILLIIGAIAVIGKADCQTCGGNL